MVRWELDVIVVDAGGEQAGYGMSDSGDKRRGERGMNQAREGARGDAAGEAGE